MDTECNNSQSLMILHIPHSSKDIPQCYGHGFIENEQEAVPALTDHFTDNLFDYSAAHKVVFPISRIVCDVERFETGEEMESKYGMGILYERDHLQRPLRMITAELKKEVVEKYYRPHHQRLFDAVKLELEKCNKALIVDCHSFNDEQLPHVQNSYRPDFCIGADLFHTPDVLTQKLIDYLQDKGYSVGVNAPFSGTIVPMHYYQKNPNVVSIMIEINKRLYLTDNFSKSETFNKTKETVADMLEIMHNFISRIILLNETISDIEINKLADESTDEELDEIMSIEGNKEHIAKLDQKSKDRLNKILTMKIKESFENIVKVMEDGNYEHLSDDDWK